MKPEITYDDFAKLDIRIGEVVAAEPVERSDKLIKCTVEFGEEIGTRTIVSGIREWRAPESLVGKKLPYIVNLTPRMFRGVESQGMLVASAQGTEGVSLLIPDEDVPRGSRVK